MKCKHCKCPLGAFFWNDEGEFCDETCADLYEDDQLLLEGFPLILAHENPFMES